MTSRSPSHVDILVQLGKHEEKHDSMREDLAEIKELLKDHIRCTDTRVGKLESWRDRLVGAYVVLAGLVTMAGTYLGFRV